MDVVNFPAIIAAQRLVLGAQIDQANDLILIGKKVNPNRDGTQYLNYGISVADFLSLITPVASGWALDGNLNGSLKSIGTKDNFDFPIITNNIEVARFTTNGDLGIGTITPLSRLHVDGIFTLVDGTQGLGFILTSDATGSTSWQPGPSSITNELDPVISQINNPPGAPVLGDRYLINTAPTGVWVGNSNSIAEWDGFLWQYTIPVLNDVVFVTNTLTTKRFNSIIWVNYAGTAILQNGNSLYVAVAIGSNNAKALVFKTSGSPRAQITAAGNFNIRNNLFVGHISTAASARVHIRGIDAAVANYALKVEDNTGSNLMFIRNDGQVKFGAGGIGFTILSGAYSASVTGSFPIYGGFGGTFEATSIGLTSDLSIGGAILFNNSGFSKIYSGGGFDIKYRTTGIHYFELGTINMSTLPVGNAGLASGDLYVDTAANILANADLVVGRKV